MSEQSNKKLYVGSLPYSVTEQELHDLFSPYGPVESVRIITDKFTGHQRASALWKCFSVKMPKKLLKR